LNWAMLGVIATVFTIPGTYGCFKVAEPQSPVRREVVVYSPEPTQAPSPGPVETAPAPAPAPASVPVRAVAMPAAAAIAPARQARPEQPEQSPRPIRRAPRDAFVAPQPTKTDELAAPVADRAPTQLEFRHVAR
jgi:hypothetical protein